MTIELAIWGTGCADTGGVTEAGCRLVRETLCRATEARRRGELSSVVRRANSDVGRERRLSITIRGTQNPKMSCSFLEEEGRLSVDQHGFGVESDSQEMMWEHEGCQKQQQRDRKVGMKSSVVSEH